MAGKGLTKLNSRSLASLPALFAALCSVVSLPALTRIISVSRQPMREVVAAIRGVSPALTQADPPRAYRFLWSRSPGAAFL